MQGRIWGAVYILDKHTQFAMRSVIHVATTQPVKPLMCATPPAPPHSCPAVDPCAAQAAPDEAAPALATLAAGVPGLLGSRGRIMPPTMHSIAEGPAVGAAGPAAAAAATAPVAAALAAGEADTDAAAAAAASVAGAGTGAGAGGSSRRTPADAHYKS